MMWSLSDREKSSLGGAGERALIEAAQGGSEAAVEELFRRALGPNTHRAAYLIVRDAAAAEDIAQEAFLSALGSLDRFDRRRPFSPWLHRIAVNRSIDWSRARKARREVGDGDALLDSALGPGAGRRAAVGERDEIVAALDQLSPGHRAVVVLRYLLEYTPGEIARLLDLPVGRSTRGCAGAGPAPGLSGRSDEGAHGCVRRCSMQGSRGARRRRSGPGAGPRRLQGRAAGAPAAAAAGPARARGRAGGGIARRSHQPGRSRGAGLGR